MKYIIPNWNPNPDSESHIAHTDMCLQRGVLLAISHWMTECGRCLTSQLLQKLIFLKQYCMYLNMVDIKGFTSLSKFEWRNLDIILQSNLHVNPSAANLHLSLISCHETFQCKAFCWDKTQKCRKVCLIRVHKVVAITFTFKC